MHVHTFHQHQYQTPITPITGYPQPQLALAVVAGMLGCVPSPVVKLIG